jgi:hypothetical protein
MQAANWAQEDIDTLHAIVSQALAQGKSREEGFKQYARMKGIKSVNAIRYKWITTSPSKAKTDVSKTHHEHDMRAKHIRADHTSGYRKEHGRQPVPLTDGTDDGDAGQLRAELDKVLGIVSKLRDKNSRLRRENRQLSQNLQATLSRLNPEKPPIVVVVGSEGWKPENLAKLIESAQHDTEGTTSRQPENQLPLRNLQL